MIIKVDEEGKKVIEQLCDIALKTGGVANLASVTNILEKTEIIGKEINASLSVPVPETEYDVFHKSVEPTAPEWSEPNKEEREEEIFEKERK